MTRLGFAAAAAVVMAVRCDAINLSKENWSVPNWTTIVTEPGAIREDEEVVRARPGHVRQLERNLLLVP